MEISGKVKKISEVQTFGTGFQKREVVVTTNEQYPQNINVEFLKDKTSLLDAINVGDDIKISININGREWINPEGVAKYFNSIVGWRIEKVAPTSANSDTNSYSPPTPTETYTPNVQSASNEPEEDDDLPF